jgi:hypothetical protein
MSSRSIAVLRSAASRRPICRAMGPSEMTHRTPGRPASVQPSMVTVAGDPVLAVRVYVSNFTPSPSAHSERPGIIIHAKWLHRPERLASPEFNSCTLKEISICRLLSRLEKHGDKIDSRS